MNTHLLTTVFLLLASLGCEREDPHGRQPLTGKVVFQGQPLQRGVIEFLPADTPQRAGARGIIRDGAYVIPREQGLPAGRYQVKITSPESNSDKPLVGPPGMEMPPLGKELIPAAYNTDSQEFVDVAAGEKNDFSFTIE